MFRKTILATALLFSTFHCSAELKPEIFTDIALDNHLSYIGGEDGAYRFDGERYISLSEFYDLPRSWVKATAINSESKYLVLAFYEGLYLVDIESKNTVKLSDILYNRLSIFGEYIYAENSLDNEIDIFNLRTGTVDEPLRSRVLELDANYIATEAGVFIHDEGTLKVLTKEPIKRAVVTRTPLGALVWHDGILSHYDSSGSPVERKLEHKPTYMTVDKNHVLINVEGKHKRLRLLTLEEVDLPIAPMAEASRYFVKEGTHWKATTNDIRVSNGTTLAMSTIEASPYNVTEIYNGHVYLGVNDQLIKNGSPLKKYRGNLTDIAFLEESLAIATTEALYIDNKEIFNGYVIGLESYRSKLFIATDNKGVLILEDGNLTPAPFNHLLPKGDILKTQHIDDNLYVSTSKGLLVFSEEKLVRHWLKQDSKVTGIFSYKDSLYIATFGNGLYRIDENSPIKIESPKLITETSVIDNIIVLGTNNGLYQFVDGQFFPLGNMKKHITANSISAKDGYIIAGTESAIIAVKPINEKVDVAPYVSAVVANGETSQLLPDSIDIHQPAIIHLATSTSYVADIHYQYSLNGKTWADAASGNIDLMGNDSGKVTIQTRGSIDGVNWQNGVAVKLTLKGAWYQSMWSKVILGAVTLLLVVLVVVYYRRREEAYNHIIAEAHNDVLAVDNVLLSLLRANAHFDENDLVETHRGRQVINECLADLGTYVLMRGGKAGVKSLKETIDSLIIQMKGANPQISISSDIALNENAIYPKQWEMHVCRALHCSLTYAIHYLRSKKVKIDIHRHEQELVVNVINDGNVNFLTRLGKLSYHEVILEFLAGLIHAKAKVAKHSIDIVIPLPIEKKASSC